LLTSEDSQIKLPYNSHGQMGVFAAAIRRERKEDEKASLLHQPPNKQRRKEEYNPIDWTLFPSKIRQIIR
jgi:hypothetical protein